MSETHESADAADDRALWEARHLERGSELGHAPSRWIVDRCLTLPQAALVLDLAGGTGRHALPVAKSGRIPLVTDFVERAVATAVARHPRVLGVVSNVSELPFRPASFDAIVVVSFLDRSVFQVIAGLLKTGGVLLYETFTRSHLEIVARGKARGPKNPAYLLEPDELPTLVAPLMVQEHEECLVVDEAGERHVARVMAMKQW